MRSRKGAGRGIFTGKSLWENKVQTDVRATPLRRVQAPPGKKDSAGPVQRRRELEAVSTPSKV